MFNFFRYCVKKSQQLINVWQEKVNGGEFPIYKRVEIFPQYKHL